MSDSENTTATAYGHLDKNALEEVRHSHDTTVLLRIVDELDTMLAAASNCDSLRDRLLRLHGMAHTVINGAGLSVAMDRETLPELAADVISEMQEMTSRLEAWTKQLEPLERLETGD